MNFKNKPLAAYEKVFWILDQTTPAHFIMAAEISGTATEEEWRSALNAVQKRHALFSVYIESNDNINPFFRYSPEAVIPLRVVEASSTSDWKNEIGNEMSLAFDWTEAPLVRASLIRAHQKSVLIISVHHAIGDGLSMSLVIRDILCSLSGKSLENLPLSPSADDLLGLTTVNQTEYQAKNIKNVPALKRKNGVPVEFQLLQLSEELTSSITERSRKEKTSVHGALCAAFVRSYIHLHMNQQAGDITVATPFSIRDILGIGESSSVSIAAKYTVFNKESETAFWDLARYAKNDLKNILSLDKITEILKGVRQRVFNNMEIEELSETLQNSLTRHLIISNLGRLSYDTAFSDLKLEALWGPFACTGNKAENFIGASTANGQMCMSIAGSNLPDSILIAVKNELATACL